MASTAYRKDHPGYFEQKAKKSYRKEDNAERYARTKDNFIRRRREYLLTAQGRLNGLAYAARDRAKARGIPCEIDHQWLVELFELQGGACALTGIPFRFEVNTPGSRRKFTPFGPSVDRIDCTQGYLKSNVRLVCVIVNVALNTFGEDAFREMCLAYISHREG